MSKFKRFQIRKIVAPFLVGIVLLFIPLVGDFHFESGLLVSLVGCFWAGIRACDENLKINDDFFTALRIAGYLFLVGVPLLIYALFTGCFSIDGLAFWLLFPLPSVFFGYAIGRLLRNWNLPYPRAITVVALFLIAVGIFLYELLNYPQVYFLNHVWGGWPGPIYDETVRISEATVFFRSLTVLWAILLWNIPTLKTDWLAKFFVGFSVLSIVISYTQLAEFGVISPRSHLKKVLDGHKTTDHFELYYDQQFYSDYEINLLAAEHEFYLQQISNHLELPPRDIPDKIESYLYAHPWQKKELVGAKFTSYVPVWLEQDQLHIAKQQIESSLKHELVHVLSKQFGNSLFNGSWSIGLIEGIAVAIDGGSSPTSTIDQIVVSEKPYPTAKELKQAFSFWGFYGGRSGVNYITSGSFVRFLMSNYPIKFLKEAYRTGDLTNAYPTDWEQLTRQWHQQLESVQVDSVDQKVASRIFGIPSLFEQECPHVVSGFAAAWDNYQFHLANYDTTRGLMALDRAVVEADSMARIKTEWSFRHLMSGHPKKVQQAASLQDTIVDLQLLYADAFAMKEDYGKARKYLRRGQQLFLANPDSLLEPALATRLDTRQWEIYRRMTYANELPDSSTFAESHYRTKIRSLKKAIDQERWGRVKIYVQQLSEIPVHQRYFDDYQKLIHNLAFRGEDEMMSRIIERLSKLPLRIRYRERLQQELDWIAFLTSLK
jgi:hypothetical protein